jgi:glutaconate CoA-transferase subunit B
LASASSCGWFEQTATAARKALPSAIDYSIDELICVCISRQVRDGDVWAQGINTPLVAAGLILGKIRYAPRARFTSAIGQALVQDWGPLGIANIENLWVGKGLIHLGFAAGAAEILPKFQPKEFFRPAQVDQLGNLNNIAFGKDYQKPRMRLPGSGGIPDVTPNYDHTYLYVPRHSRLTFAQKLDFVSGMGHVPHRRRGGGPRYLITDLGEFDWAEGRMRLRNLHPGVTAERVRRKTAFQLDVADGLGETPAPDAEDLRLLRQEIDPLATRKLETLAGSARKELLRAILRRENAP